jgi:SAM-dependent methyltransferase
MPSNGTNHAGVARVTPAMLAAAMRAGLDARQSAGPAPTPESGATCPLQGLAPGYQAHAGLLGRPVIVKPGRLAPAVRFLRRLLRALLRPWLEFQTIFNQQTVNQLESLRGQVNNNLDGIQKCLMQLAEQIDRCNQRLDDENFFNGFVNRELGLTGRIAQAGLFFNPPVFVQVDRDGAHVAMITERIVEHIFVHTRLPRPPARVLDLGCAESTNALEMASLGYDVVGADLRELPLKHPNFRMTVADIGDLPFPDGSFDVVVSLSTVEHVGLNWYSPQQRGTTDHDVIRQAHRLLRPGGRFLLTVPFGRRAVTPVHRIYDEELLDALLRPFRRIETCFAVRDGDAWLYTEDVGRAAAAESAQRVGAVALVVAEKS